MSPNKTILIIEDDDLLREIYATKFEMEGFSVQTARDGFEGLQKATHTPPDVILLDMIMPRMTGLEFLQAYRLKPAHPNVVAVVMSNKSSALDIGTTKALGVVDYLIKSQHTPEQIVTRLRSYLNQSQE